MNYGPRPGDEPCLVLARCLWLAGVLTHGCRARTWPEVCDIAMILVCLVKEND